MAPSNGWIAAFRPLVWANVCRRRPSLADALEEVQVIAARVKLAELRAEIVKTEDAFYELLNKLLDDPEMRVNCENGPAVGTHISQRTCGPQFVATANANYARGLAQELALQGLAEDGRYRITGSYSAPVSPGVAIGSNEIAFRRKVVSLLKENQGLRELAVRREKLEVLLTAARKARARK